MSETREDFLSRILDGTIEQLDITLDSFLAAEQRYTDVGKQLADAGAKDTATRIAPAIITIANTPA